MGQRSQIYVAYETKGQKVLVARYFQWNYGARMISRARGIIEWSKERLDYFDYEAAKLPQIMETNWDMRDIVKSCDILKETADYYESANEREFFDTVFYGQDNNDGKLFIKIEANGEIKYALTDDECKELMDAARYMKWDNCDGDTESNIEENLKWFAKEGVLMTRDELDEFLQTPYGIPEGVLKKEGFKTITLQAHPYAHQTGTLQVPEELATENDMLEYIREHFTEIHFGEIDLDYCGTDVDIDEDDLN